jgi:non-lysosomal glucosylceramidase
MECCDYPHYNTLDLRIYAASAISQNWPKLSRSVITFYADAVLKDDKRIKRSMRYMPAGEMIDTQAEDACMKITEKGQAPHDLGSPFDDPIHLVNSYNFQNTNNWKDLNSNFILAAYRELSRSPDKKLCKRLYTAILSAFERLTTCDKDGDGLIENEGEDMMIVGHDLFGE